MSEQPSSGELLDEAIEVIENLISDEREERQEAVKEAEQFLAKFTQVTKQHPTSPPSGVMSAEEFLRALSTAWTHDACGHAALDMIHLRDEAILAEPQKRIEQLLDAIRERNEIIEGLEKRHTSEEAIRREKRSEIVKALTEQIDASTCDACNAFLSYTIQKLEREQQEQGK